MGSTQINLSPLYTRNHLSFTINTQQLSKTAFFSRPLKKLFCNQMIKTWQITFTFLSKFHSERHENDDTQLYHEISIFGKKAKEEMKQYWSVIVLTHGILSYRIRFYAFSACPMPRKAPFTMLLCLSSVYWATIKNNNPHMYESYSIRFFSIAFDFPFGGIGF